MKRYSQHDANFDGVTHFNYPPEAKYMNKSQNPLKTKSELDYSEFLDNTILSWDSYSLALCLSQQFNGFSHILDYIIKDKTKNKIISTFLRDADSLVQSYIEFDKMSSNELETYIGNGGKHLRNQDLEHLRDEYIALLKDSKIYKDTNPKPSKEVIEIAKANSIQYMVEKKCKEGKEPHPITNRCVNKCKQGETRDSTGKCKKMSNGKTTAKKVTNSSQ